MKISNQIKLFLFWSILALMSITSVQAAQDHNIANSINHLKEALKTLSENKIDETLEHINVARQAAKNVIGGSYEVQTQRASGAMGKARRLLKQEKMENAETQIKKAIGILEKLADPNSQGGRGGLN